MPERMQDLAVAALTCWETAMLARAGKLRVRGPVLGWLEQSPELTRTTVVSFAPAIAVDDPRPDSGDTRQTHPYMKHERGSRRTRLRASSSAIIRFEISSSIV